MKCSNCNNDIPEGSAYCPRCGMRLIDECKPVPPVPVVAPEPETVHAEEVRSDESGNNRQQEVHQRVIYVQRRGGNGLGIAGFVLSLFASLLLWIPLYGWFIGGILGVLGFVFCFAGLFRSPRGFAVAGLVILAIGVYLAFNFTKFLFTL